MHGSRGGRTYQGEFLVKLLHLATCWIIIILPFPFCLGFVLCGFIGIGNVFAAERIEPNIHRAVIDDLNFIKIKLGMIPQVIFDNLRKKMSIFILQFRSYFLRPYHSFTDNSWRNS
jgi:hypothetical protein